MNAVFVWVRTGTREDVMEAEIIGFRTSTITGCHEANAMIRRDFAQGWGWRKWLPTNEIMLHRPDGAQRRYVGERRTWRSLT